jgi:hypothetical protein
MKAIYKRPVLLSIACIFAFVGMTYSVLYVFHPEIKRMGEWFPAVFGLIVAVRFIALIGVWHMKRWGVELYIIAYFTRLFFVMYTGQLASNATGLVMSLAWMIVFIVFYKRMDLNL